MALADLALVGVPVEILSFTQDVPGLGGVNLTPELCALIKVLRDLLVCQPGVIWAHVVNANTFLFISESTK
jgi:hypothetical protein